MSRLRLFFLLLAAGAAIAAVPEADIRVTALPQQRLRIEPGQYSGITYLSGDMYAVVDDKLPGGGIVLFELPLRQDGRVQVAGVRRTVPEGTLSASGPILDSEGVAYAGGKLYVSSENDQSIREYGLDGQATGRTFAIPAEFGKDAITYNAGFEALTFHAASGSFWTTTELPLKTDGAASHLHRLQRFDARFQAREQCLYQMDEPSVPQAASSSAQAYVYGIPALTALDDGRLIVLEREIYVPAGEPRDILRKSFSRVKLYLVSPEASDGGVLSKQLLYSFQSGISLNIKGVNVEMANYEGMCLGPRLPDGRRCLVLIADSQAGMSRQAARLGRKQLTSEYVKVILLEGEGV